MLENHAEDGSIPPKRALLEAMSIPGKFSLLMLFFFVGMIVANVLGILAILPFLHFEAGATFDMQSLYKQLNNYSDAGLVKGLKIAQVISAIVTFIVPAIIFTALTTKKKAAYLRINTSPLFVSVVMCVLIILSAQPLISITGEWNAHMQLPEFLKKMEQWMEAAEKSMAEITKAFLKMEGTGDLIVNLLIIALLAAFAEEIFFRGCLQRVIMAWTRNPHAAIWITAALFSALHFQFYGFLPRMLIGALLGYLFYWSGSLWLPILGHFTNNALGVILSYLVQKKAIPEETETLGAADGQGILLLSSSLLLVMWLLLLYRFEKTKPRIIAEP